RLERNFGIKIPRGELFPENISDPELVENGKLTEKGLAEIKGRMPYADLSEFSANPEVDKLFDLYTVDMLVNYVSSKLATAAWGATAVVPVGSARPAGSRLARRRARGSDALPRTLSP